MYGLFLDYGVFCGASGETAAVYVVVCGETVARDSIAVFLFECVECIDHGSRVC